MEAEKTFLLLTEPDRPGTWAWPMEASQGPHLGPGRQRRREQFRIYSGISSRVQHPVVATVAPIRSLLGPMVVAVALTTQRAVPTCFLALPAILCAAYVPPVISIAAASSQSYFCCLPPKCW